MEGYLSSFESFEHEYNLFDIQLEGVSIWERLRFPVYNQVLRQHGIGRAHTNVGDHWRDYIKAASLILKNLVYRNPYFSKPIDLLFVGHHRRKKLSDGFWWDIYCDPIHEVSNYDYLHVEKPNGLTHHRPARTSELRYIDLIEFGGKLPSIVGWGMPDIKNQERDKLKVASEGLSKQFDTDIDLYSLAIESIHTRKYVLPLYEQLLVRLDPKLVVVVVSYGRESLIEACKKADIPVVELQHGIIHQGHLGYHYPDDRVKETFPDYLLVWGEFWKQQASFPVSHERIITVGYPYLEQKLNKYSKIQPKNQLLFISQGTIGEELSKFAVEVNEHPDITYDVIYKLHPGEYARWKEEYPWLIDSNIEIVDEPHPPLYQLFAESSAQIGVSSTALYEGLAFGLETIVYDCTGSESMQHLIDEGVANLASSVWDILAILGSEQSEFNVEYYFAPDSISQSRKILEELAALDG